MSISAKESFGQYLALCNDFEGKRNASPLLSHVNRLGREALVKPSKATVATHWQ